MAANSIGVMSEKLLPVNFDPVNENFFSDGPIDKRYQHFFVETDTSAVAGATRIDNIIALTQAQYDAITTPDASTFYVITP
jgi:hypothetical protein